MMQVSFDIRAYALLLAALEFAAKDNVHYYLNAVHIAPNAGGAHIVATDSCALFIGRAKAASLIRRTAGGLEPFTPLTIERFSLIAALKAVKKGVKAADTLRLELDENGKDGRITVFNFGVDPLEENAITAPLIFFNESTGGKWVNYARAIPRCVAAENTAPLIDCKYLTAVCKAATALRPARSRASFRIEGAGAMEAVISLDDDAAAVVMGIHAPDSGRYEETITGILDAE